MSILGVGINVMLGGNAVSPSSGSTSGTPFSATLDEDGQASISVANANTKKYVASFQVPAGAQSGIQRLDPTNEDEIILEADIQGLASGKVIAGRYW